MKKRLTLLLAVVLIFSVTVGATLAWLQDTTDTVENTFTIGNIDIELEETWNTPITSPTSWSAKLIPGSPYAKDPIVTVIAGSEKCYLFVKVVEANNSVTATVDGTDVMVSPIVNYDIALTGNGFSILGTPTTSNGEKTTIYWKVVDTATSDQEFEILTDTYVTNDELKGSVQINSALTKDHIEAIITEPSLTFTAYAVQFENMTDANEAWTVATTGNK